MGQPLHIIPQSKHKEVMLAVSYTIVMFYSKICIIKGVSSCWAGRYVYRLSVVCDVPVRDARRLSIIDCYALSADVHVAW